ncbi:hypothetical protein [Niveispirillum fermenti]|uniref:hypothetical protein n=1 Tax=Niveispirillum fermenti TaxID=1233113 RepID=UPI003A8B963F
MIATLTGLLRGRWLLLAGMLALAGLGWSWHGRGQALDAARLAEALARETAARNAAAVTAVTAAAERNLAAVTAAAMAERERLRASAAIERRIEHAPDTSACADSGAIGAVLDGLRARQAGADGSAGGTGAGAGRPADLHGGARPAPAPGG